MPTISLTDFVDFAIAAGPSQLTKVREIANRGGYDPKFDFWKQLREGIRKLHENGTKLDPVLVGLTDPKKIKRYPAAVKAYKKFLGKKSLGWFEPPSGLWTYEGLTVKVNPELGLEIGGQKVAAKLYFKDERPTRQRLRVVFELMRSSLDLNEGTVPGVIDVGSSRLIPPTSSEGLSVLLEAQALAFMHLWNSITASAKAAGAGTK